MVLDKKLLGNRIKEARKLKAEKTGKRFTGEMLANELGISRSYLGDIESGRTYPNYVLINKIAEACEVQLTFFGNIVSDIDNDVDINQTSDYTNPEEALKFILSQPSFMSYGGYDLNQLSDEEILEIANDMLFAMRLSLEKINKKRSK